MKTKLVSMKKLIFSALLISVVLFACQKEDDVDTLNRNQNTNSNTNANNNNTNSNANNNNSNTNTNTNNNSNNNNSNTNNNNNNNNNSNTNNNNNNNNNNPSDPYAENEALIQSSTYIICDVEGIDSIQKYNLQSYNNTCEPHWGSMSCSAGYAGFLSSCVNLTSQPGLDMVIEVGFAGACPACTPTDLVNEGVQHIEAKEESFNGASVRLIFISSSEVYATQHVPGAQQQNDSIEVMEITTGSSRRIEVRFTCTLKNSDGSKTIRLKNAVFRSRIQ